MTKKIVVKKGYTIEVESWENDGDNYCTRTITVDDKDYALAVLDMCKTIFNDEDGIGNMIGDEETDEAPGIILNYLEGCPLIKKDTIDTNILIDRVMDINYSLMGSSEYYYSRVFENGSIVYSPEDIVLEVISEVRV